MLRSKCVFLVSFYLLCVRSPILDFFYFLSDCPAVYFKKYCFLIAAKIVS